MNIADSDVESLLKKLTFCNKEDLEIVMKEHNVLPDNRVAQKHLAAAVTEMVHGSEALNQALGNSHAFFAFDWSESSKMSQSDFEAWFGHTERVVLGKDELLSLDLCSLLTHKQVGLRKTKADARRVIEQGGVQVNGVGVKSNC